MSGRQKGYARHLQQLLDPIDIVPVKPSICSCGSPVFHHAKPFYTHQQVELPEIELEVTQYVLHKGLWIRCGRHVASQIGPTTPNGIWPKDECLDWGAQRHAGRQPQIGLTVFKFVGIFISTGAIQKVIDRVSDAIELAYKRIGQVAHRN